MQENVIAQDEGDSRDLWEERWLRFVSLCHLPRTRCTLESDFYSWAPSRWATTTPINSGIFVPPSQSNLLFTRSGRTWLRESVVWAWDNPHFRHLRFPSHLQTPLGNPPLMRAQHLEPRGWRQDGAEEYCHDACSCIDLYMTVGRETLPRRTREETL
ncbi:hypothetical protein BGX38DRAFT_20150 [Terfezia claveryi]|nr:hypothetical protein BGX38DRAFT_20150 [Terfezia claveryi]